MPCLPPSLFSVLSTPAGVSFLPFTPTQLPFTKSSSTYSGLSGASSGETESLNIPLFALVGSNHGSSRMPAS